MHEVINYIAMVLGSQEQVRTTAYRCGAPSANKFLRASDQFWVRSQPIKKCLWSSAERKDKYNTRSMRCRHQAWWQAHDDTKEGTHLNA